MAYRFIILGLLTGMAVGCSLLAENENHPTDVPVAGESVPLFRERIRYLGRDRVEIDFREVDGSPILIGIGWLDQPEGECTRIGPLRGISLSRDGEGLRVVPDMEVRRIEDVDFGSCRLSANYPEGYLLELTWGVGESRVTPRRIRLDFRQGISVFHPGFLEPPNLIFFRDGRWRGSC